MAFQIKTQIEINASSEKIWNILMDTNKYHEWNPFIKSITGDIQEGQKISAHIDNMKFSPTILKVIENSELEWIGSLGMKGIFDGKHKFQIIDKKDGSCTFIQSEEFKGILVPLFKSKLNKDTRSGFNKMNEALKIEAEK